MKRPYLGMENLEDEYVYLGSWPKTQVVLPFAG